MQTVKQIMKNLQPSTCEKIIRHYIPGELIPSNWKCFSWNLEENIKNLLPKIQGSLKVYDSAESLFNDLLKFIQYPGCFKVIGVDMDDRFKNGITIYKSPKGKEYIYKIDLYTVIYRVLHESMGKIKCKLVNESIIYHLKNLESLVTNHSEMIKYPREKLEDMKETISKLFNALRLDDLNEKAELIKDSEDVIQKWKTVLNKCGTLESEKELLVVLNKSFDHCPVRGNEKKYTKFFELLKIIISQISIIEAEYSLQNNTNRTPIVRLFCQIENDGVMVHELLKIMREEEINVLAFEKSINRRNQLEFLMSDYLAFFVRKEDFKQLEFVRIPIQNSKLASSPIPLENGEYCISSNAAIRHLELDMTHHKNVFQMATPEELPLIRDIFKSINGGADSCYFVNLEQVNKVRQSWNSLFESHFKNKSIEFQPKKIRKVNERRRITVEDLKNELDYLNLARVFPKIKERAEEVYSSLKETGMTGTILMRELIHECQIESFRARFMENSLSDVHSEPTESISESSSEPSSKPSEDSPTSSNLQLKKTTEEKERLEKKLQEKEVIIDVLKAQNEMYEMKNEELKKEIRKNSSMSLKPSNSVSSDESKDALFNLLTIRNTINTENPLKKAEEITRSLLKTSNDESVKMMSIGENVLFEKFGRIYIKSVNRHIEKLRIQPEIPSNWVPNLPDFPQFSQQFLDQYKKTMKSEAPRICENLIKSQELEDKECLICMEDVDSNENTVKCENCKRRYHNTCISDWLKKRQCAPRVVD
uniref:RING-type domain-containing protein n=2 Tax=Caenorhabditis tropicalis TaxID=1561998 RepID=A0A1I7TLA2_9PELO